MVPRRTRLLVLIIIPLLMLVGAIVAIPYRIEEEYINRKTGEIRRETLSLLVHRGEPRVWTSDKLSDIGALTAPDEWLLVAKRVFPFPWSRVSSARHWLAEAKVDHWHLEMIRNSAFSGAREGRRWADPPTMGDEAFSALMLRRLELWNTLTIDQTLEDTADQILRENERLFPGAAKPKVITVTTTTVAE